MRTLEALLILANGLTFLLLVIPASRSTRWVGFSTAAAILLNCAQIVMEGSRWQLYPAYLLNVSNFGVWMLLRHHLRRDGAFTHPVVAALAFGLSAAVLAIAIALPLALPVFAFPAPSGPYAIGTVTYHWTDTGRPEVFGPAPRKSRELMVQIWYPAEPQASTNRGHYVDNADVLSAAQGRLYGLPAFTFTHLKYVTTNASPSVSISA